MTILIVEPAPCAFELLRGHLGSEAVEVLPDPVAARAGFQPGRHRLTLIDLDLPGSVDLLEWLKPSPTRRVVFGRAVDRDRLQRIGRAGLDGFLNKPLSPDALELCLETLLAVEPAPEGVPGLRRGRSRGLSNHQLERVEALIGGALDRGLSLDELAGSLGLSRAHFGRLFRQTTGTTPYRLLTSRRMSRAQALLVDTNWPIAEVAASVGFENQAYFATLFKRHTGDSPSAFRARCRPQA